MLAAKNAASLLYLNIARRTFTSSAARAGKVKKAKKPKAWFQLSYIDAARMERFKTVAAARKTYDAVVAEEKERMEPVRWYIDTFMWEAFAAGTLDEPLR